ncbi:hypothetical protein SLEP1_g36151 [Rubroshorea leprosula]|uniref:Uncharacterized protein n=1 Tax=Rubroshorea leprosula TaxID=152421 RepID=A0AAV5KQX9_9ROSI|nr:hypothetical protein SLEP1_g36151 [Rubroshorea leprosula]
MGPILAFSLPVVGLSSSNHSFAPLQIHHRHTTAPQHNPRNQQPHRSKRKKWRKNKNGKVEEVKKPKCRSNGNDDEDEDGNLEDSKENGKAEEVNKPKQNKQKKPMVSDAEATAKVDPADLVGF